MDCYGTWKDQGFSGLFWEGKAFPDFYGKVKAFPNSGAEGWQGASSCLGLAPTKEKSRDEDLKDENLKDEDWKVEDLKVEDLKDENDDDIMLEMCLENVKWRNSNQSSERDLL